MVYGIPRYLPKLNRLIPAPLFALVAATLFYIYTMEPGITPVIGNIPTGFPHFRLPVLEPKLLLEMIASGLTLAGLSAIDSLLTSLVADNITHTQHKSNRELIGQGIGNTVAGFFGGLPGAGATMRTVINVNAGGRTLISGMLHAIILLAIVLGAGVLARDIPKAVLAGILIKIGTDIIDWDYLKRLKHAPRAGIVIMLTVFIVTITIDLLLAVGIGMVMASFLFMHRMTQMQIANIDTVTASKQVNYLSPEEAEIMDEANGRIMIFHLSGPMSFSSAKSMVRRHASTAGYEIMLLDLSDVPRIDYTTTRALEDIIMNAIDSGRRLFVVGAQQEVCDMLVKLGATRHVKTGKMYTERFDALLHAQSLLKEIN